MDLSAIFSNITREFMYIPLVNYAPSNNKKTFLQERITVFAQECIARNFQRLFRNFHKLL